MLNDFIYSPDDSHIMPGAVARTTIQNLSSAYEGQHNGRQETRLKLH